MNTGAFSGELTLRAGNSSIQLPDIPQPIISALHEAAVGARDHIEAFKYRLLAIKVEDIRQVYEMLAQWTHQYNIQSQVTQIVAEHRNTETGATTSRKNFRSIDDFLKYDDSNIDPVSLLTVRFSFILKNPNSNRLESYDISLEFPEAVDFRSDLLVSDIVKDNYAFLYSGRESWSLKVRIEYSDYVTAVALQSMISSWYATIDGKGRSWSARKKRFYEQLLIHSNYHVFSPGSFMIRWFPSTFSLIIATSLVPVVQATFETIGASVALLLVFFGLTMLVEFVLRKTIYFVDKSSNSSSRTPILLLNAGNRKIFDEERERTNNAEATRIKVGKLLFGSIFLSMIVSVCANIVTYYVWGGS